MKKNFVSAVNKGFKEDKSNSRFVDADLSSSDSFRYDRVYNKAVSDYEDIVKNSKGNDKIKTVGKVK